MFSKNSMKIFTAASLVSCLSNSQIARVGGSMIDDFNTACEDTTNGKMFDNYFGQPDGLATNHPYSVLDSFIIHHFDLEEEPSFNDTEEEKTPLMNFTELFNSMYPAESMTLVNTSLDGVSNCLDSLTSEVMNYRDIVEDTNEEDITADGVSTSDYDVLKNLFYAADLEQTTQTTGKDTAVAERFMTYFLRRFHKFTKKTFDEYKKQIAMARNSKTRKAAQKQDPKDLYLLNLDADYDLKYYDNQEALFKRIVTSPIYEVEFTAFITELTRQFEVDLHNQHEANTPINTTYTLYYVVLKNIMSQVSRISINAEGVAESFLQNKRTLFFANIPLIYDSNVPATIKKGEVCFIPNADIDMTEVVKRFE